MSTERKGVGIVTVTIVILLILLGVMVLTPLKNILLIPFAFMKVREREQILLKPEIYMPAGTNLALYCQSIDLLQLTDYVPVAQLPEPLSSLDQARGRFGTNSAHVEFGGGFHHFGYNLTLDEETSSAESNWWKLAFYSEGSSGKTLMRFVIPSTNRFSPERFVRERLAEYSRRIAANPDDIDWQQAKIRFITRYDPSQLKPACLDAIKSLPDHWWPRLTLALVKSGRGSSDEASREFEEYVERKPSYSRYLYLAWYFQAMSRPEKAAEAIEKAVRLPIVDMQDDDTNTESRGYSAAIYAFRSGQYRTVIMLCDQLLPVRENGDYAKPALRSLRAAAENAVAGGSPNVEQHADMFIFNPYEGIDLDTLLGR